MGTAASPDLTGVVAFVILVSALLTPPISLGLLKLYRRAVRLAMRRHAGIGAFASASAPVLAPREVVPEPLTLQVVEEPLHLEASRPEGALLGLMLRRPRIAVLIYSLGGVAQAVLTTAIWLMATGIEPDLRRTAVLIWINAWPIVLTANLVLSNRWRQQAVGVGLYLLGLLALAGPSWAQALAGWVLLMGVPTLFLLALLHPKLRAIGPLVFVFALVGVTGSQLAISALNADDRAIGALASLAVALEIDALVALLWVVLVGFALFAILGWFTLTWIRRRYEAKQISDQSIFLDALWLTFSVLGALSVMVEGLSWSLATLAAFAAYKGVTAIGFGIVSGQWQAWQARRLLLLRVFGSQARSERLMGTVGARWRYAGSIQLIAGVDLATATIEPHELLDFVSGRLANRYIKDRAMLERQLTGVDTRPDGDGRYRINDFFCYDDTWKMTLSHLVLGSDAILMDLRGFTPANQGVVFELRELVHVAPLARVLLITDASTDVDFLREVVDEAWAALPPGSPNEGQRAPRLTLCRLREDVSSQIWLLLTCLARAAAGVSQSEPVATPVIARAPA